MTQQLHILAKTPCFTIPHITKAQCTTETPHTITEVPQAEDSPGYGQFLQNYKTQINNIMNPNNNSSEKSVGQADKVGENLLQENPGLHIEANEDEPQLKPHYICGLWTQFPSLIQINLIDANLSQPLIIPALPYI